MSNSALVMAEVEEYMSLYSVWHCHLLLIQNYFDYLEDTDRSAE